MKTTNDLDVTGWDRELMKEILEKVKTRYVDGRKKSRGLCLVANSVLNLFENRKFNDYLKKHPPRKKYWYTKEDMSGFSQIPNQYARPFYWKPGNMAARIKWLDKHIKLNSLNIKTNKL